MQARAPGEHSCIELIQFAAAVSSSSYKGVESDRIATMLTDLLKTKALQLHRDIRKACVSALILMRNKGAVAPLDLLELFFEVMSTVPDKDLRELLFRHIVSDVRNINKNGKRDDKVNRSVQSFLHRILHNTESSEIASKRAVDMVCELYRRRVWTDARTVAILASAVESPITTVSARAMRFFLNIEEKMAKDTRLQQEGEWFEKHGVVDRHLHSRKTKRRQRQTQRALKNRKKAQRKKEFHAHEGDWMDGDVVDVESSKKLYPAIELLRDPQGLAEFVFKKLKAGSSMKYETKLS
jgi:protein SDA1